MNTRRVEQIRRRWWVVLAVAVPVMVAAVLPSLFAHPTYVGKSALVMSSPGRAPDQDAVMVLGFATIFNDPATIPRLSATTYVPEDTTFEARTAAGSPVLIVEATADDPAVAQEAARIVAEAFRDDINSVRNEGNTEVLAELEGQLDEMLRSPVVPGGLPNPMLAPLQEQIERLRYDTTNQLLDLKLRAGVDTIAPGRVFNLVLGAAGGLLLGVLAALGMAAFSTRLRNSADVRDKTGVEPLVEVPATVSAGRDSSREHRLRTLASTIGLQERPKPTVIALTDSRGVLGARNLAEALATLWARQDRRTVLVYADNESPSVQRVGFNDALVDSRLVHSMLIDGEVESLKIVPSGSAVADRYSLMTRERIVSVIDELRTCADSIIVVAPTIADATEAQLVCAAADLTILVVAKDSSRAGDVTSAVEALANAHAVLLGAVLIDANEPQSQHPPTSRRRRTAPQTSEADTRSRRSNTITNSVGG